MTRQAWVRLRLTSLPPPVVNMHIDRTPESSNQRRRHPVPRAKSRDTEIKSKDLEHQSRSLQTRAAGLCSDRRAQDKHQARDNITCLGFSCINLSHRPPMRFRARESRAPGKSALTVRQAIAKYTRAELVSTPAPVNQCAIEAFTLSHLLSAPRLARLSTLLVSTKHARLSKLSYDPYPDSGVADRSGTHSSSPLRGNKCSDGSIDDIR